MKKLVYLGDYCISAAGFGLENFLFDKPNDALNKKFSMSNRSEAAVGISEGKEGSMDIGGRIKHLRKQKGLTLEELASRSELSKGFLSQLERNLTSPSVATLDDILEALGTNLAEFFKEEQDERIVFRAADFYVDEKENHTIRWIVPNAQKHSMEPILLELPPGGRSFEMSPTSGEEFAYVIEGSVVLCCDDKRSPVRKGETFYMKCNTFHHLENEKKMPARVLWVSNPPLF